MNFIHHLYIVLLLSILGCQTQENNLFGRIVHVADGDSMTLLNENNQQVKIRLYGIDCPEYKQAFYNVAKNFTKDKVLGKYINIEIMDTDTYGRTVGIVYLENGQVLNEELLRAGLAWHYTFYDTSELFATLEQHAREDKIGIWSEKNPIAPWNFRRQQKRK